MKAVKKIDRAAQKVAALERQIEALEDTIKSKAFELELWYARYRATSYRYGTISDREFLEDSRLPSLVCRVVKLLPDDVPEELCHP